MGRGSRKSYEGHQIREEGKWREQEREQGGQGMAEKVPFIYNVCIPCYDWALDPCLLCWVLYLKFFSKLVL